MSTFGALRVAVILIGALMIGCSKQSISSAQLPAEAIAAQNEANRSFTYVNKSIHPGLVMEFEGWLSDGGPITLAVDVRSAFGTDEYPEYAVSQEGSRIAYDVPDTHPSEHYSYERLGTISNNIHVLKTNWNMGGTGVFRNLLFVRFDVERFTTTTSDADYRLVMRVVRDLSLGDRDDGDIQVLKDRVIVGRSRYRETELVVLAGQ